MRVTAREIRARGVSEALTPVVDVARDPRWGRIEETFGEDPYLVGELGVAAVEGLQGEHQDRELKPGKVFATLKHLTGHGQPESGTNVGPAPYSERTLREFFFPPFEQAILRTGVSAVMPSYNEIDGVPSHANVWLLDKVLRGEWGFQGAVVSDYYAIDDLMNVHHIAGDIEQAARLALEAGVDIDLPSGTAYATLTQQVRDGRVPEARIDASVRRLLALKFRAGLFEHPYADADRAAAITNNAEARALALKAAQRTLILLKNDGTLPLRLPDAGAPKPVIAVIGPNAAIARLGGYYGQPPVTVSILDGIKSKVGSRAEVLFAQGVKITANDDWWVDEVELADPADNRRLIDAAVAVARRAGQIVLALGDTEQTSREGWAKTHLGDRSSLDLVGEQQALFDALRALGKPISVVLDQRPSRLHGDHCRAGECADRGMVCGRAGRQRRRRRAVRGCRSGWQAARDHPAQRRAIAFILQRQTLRPSRLPVRYGRSAVPFRLWIELHDLRYRCAAVVERPDKRRWFGDRDGAGSKYGVANRG